MPPLSHQRLACQKAGVHKSVICKIWHPEDSITRMLAVNLSVDQWPTTLPQKQEERLFSFQLPAYRQRKHRQLVKDQEMYMVHLYPWSMDGLVLIFNWREIGWKQRQKGRWVPVLQRKVSFLSLLCCYSDHPPTMILISGLIHIKCAFTFDFTFFFPLEHMIWFRRPNCTMAEIIKLSFKHLNVL